MMTPAQCLMSPDMMMRLFVRTIVQKLAHLVHLVQDIDQVFPLRFPVEL